MGRPKQGSLSSYPQPLGDLVKQIREEDSGYGAQSIHAELQYKYGYSREELPSHSTIAAYLKEQGLTKRYEPHSSHPKVTVEVKEAHDVWQLDGRGNENIPNVGAITLLDVKDVQSHAYVSCFPAQMQSMKGHPNTHNYQTALRLGFLEFGLPKLVQVDHASVFYDNNSKSPFPTKLHLWLIGLGISLFYSRVHRPTDQGMVERSHEVLYQQILKSKTPFRDWEHLFEKCNQRRKALNYQIDSHATNNQPPLINNPKARYSKRPYTLQNEPNIIDLNKIYDFLSKGKWFRKVAGNKLIFLGGQSYYIRNAQPKEQLEITFCKHCQFLLFQNDKELLIEMKPIQGINEEILMGSIANFYSLKGFQLQIPFDFDDKSDTTFLEFTLA